MTETELAEYDLHLSLIHIYLGRAMYWMPMFEEEASAGRLRGLEVGDSYADIVVRFPNPLDVYKRQAGWRAISIPRP